MRTTHCFGVSRDTPRGGVQRERLECLLQSLPLRLGLEDLCTQLHERSVEVNSSELTWIRALTSEMDLPPETWDFLEDPVRDS